MLATYNHRAVRAVRRAHEWRMRPWRLVPALAWFFLGTALLLIYAGLRLAVQLDPMSPAFLVESRTPDIVMGVAGVFAMASLVAFWKEARR